MPTPYEDGPIDAQICLIGEAPSFEEMRSNALFVGPAGKLLDLCLHSAKISRAECRILNVFPEMVKKKDDDGAIYSRQGEELFNKKGLTPIGMEAAKGFFERLSACQANVLVPLGGVALSATLDNRSISKWRGSILSNATGRKIIPTFHPSYCLRGAYEARHIIISDLLKVRRNADFPDVRLPQRTLITDPSFEQCIDFLTRCLSASIVGTDIEILHGQVDCFSLALSPFEVISIPIVDAGFEHRWTPEQEAQIWELYARILQNPNIAKVNQNIGFDLAALLQLNHIVPCGPIHDCMIAHSILLPFLDKDLGMLCSLYTDEPYFKDQGNLRDSQKVDDFRRRWLYNARDAAVAFECHLALQPLLDDEGLRGQYDRTINLLGSLIAMTVNGIRVDQERLAVAKIQAEQGLTILVEKISSAVGRRIITEAPKKIAEKRAAEGSINVNSPAQLMAYFYGEKKIKPYTNAGGRPTIDDKALARIVRRYGLPEARLIQEYRALAKLKSTYYDVEFDEADSRVHCSWNPRGTWTGRLSSSKHILGGKNGEGSGFNLQNQPEEMRGFLVSDNA